MYGDWPAESIVPGFNATKNSNEEFESTCYKKCDGSHFITFKTLDKINVNSLNTYFIINVYDGFLDKYCSITTKEITGNSDNLPSVGTNKNILIKIEDFEKHESGLGYSIKPTFIFDIGEILPYFGGRFSIEIIHVNDLLNFTYKSEDLFFNRGEIPHFSGVNSHVIISDLERDTTFCSGLRYIKPNFGAIRYILTGVEALNHNAATAVKVTMESPLLNEPYQYKLDNSEFHPYKCDYDADDLTWSIIRPIASGLTALNKNVPISGTINNAFGSNEFQSSVNLLLYTPKDEKDTPLIETFNDEGERILLEYNEIQPWQSEESLYKLNGLMVIPGVGLAYPFGDYTNSMPINTSPFHTATGNYNFIHDNAYGNQSFNYDLCTGWKYYFRQFRSINADPEMNKKQSGAFIIDGLTKEEFFNSNFEFKVCIIKGANPVWFDLKKPRQAGIEVIDKETEEVTDIIYDGILSDILESNDGRLYIKWALNNSDYTDGNMGSNAIINGLLVKIGMTERMPNTLIRRIELRNYAMNKSW